MQVTLKLTGLTGLVYHNEQMADPQNPIVKNIAEYTKKKKNKTDADQKEIEHLEFLGGLYFDKEMGVYVPTYSVVRSLQRAAALTREGTKLISAFIITVDRVPLLYKGPKNPEELWLHDEYHYRKLVGVQRNRVIRMRPIFRQWALQVDGELLTDVLNPADFVRIANLAGRANGIGDARALGMGRFTAEVEFGPETGLTAAALAEEEEEAA